MVSSACRCCTAMKEKSLSFLPLVVSNEANVSKQRSERLESDFSLLQTEAEQLEEDVNGIDDFSGE